jgi:hypothetical protein
VTQLHFRASHERVKIYNYSNILKPAKNNVGVIQYRIMYRGFHNLFHVHNQILCKSMNKEKMIEINSDRVFDLADSLSASTYKK